MANRWSTQFFGTLEKKPFQLACKFKVAPTDTAGAGITAGSLAGPGIANVFMNSTASFSGDTHSNTTVNNISSTANLRVGMLVKGSGIPAKTYIASITSSTAIVLSQAATATASGVTITYAAVGSPNPAAGLIFVQFQDNFNKYLFGTANFEGALSGSSINISTGSSLTIGAPYVITSVGTTTTAQWVAVGVPVGITPAVGVSFIASATSGSGTGTVQAPAASGISDVEVVGQANGSITSSAATVLGVSSGAYIILQCLASGAGALTMNSYTPAGTNSAPALTLNSYTPAGTNDSSTPPVFTGTPAVLTGSVAAPVFTGTPAVLTGSVSAAALALAAPTAGSWAHLSFFLSNSFITVQGQ